MQPQNKSMAKQSNTNNYELIKYNTLDIIYMQNSIILLPDPYIKIRLPTENQKFFGSNRFAVFRSSTVLHVFLMRSLLPKLYVHPIALTLFSKALTISLEDVRSACRPFGQEQLPMVSMPLGLSSHLQDGNIYNCHTVSSSPHCLDLQMQYLFLIWFVSLFCRTSSRFLTFSWQLRNQVCIFPYKLSISHDIMNAAFCCWTVHISC